MNLVTVQGEELHKRTNSFAIFATKFLELKKTKKQKQKKSKKFEVNC